MRQIDLVAVQLRMEPKLRQMKPSVRSGPGEVQPGLGLCHLNCAAMRWVHFAETMQNAQIAFLTKVTGQGACAG